MTEKMIGLHFGPKDDVQKHDLLLQRNYAGIIKNIYDGGHDVFVTRGAGHYDFQDGEVNEIWLPRLDDNGLRTRRRLGETAIAHIGAVRDFGKRLRPTKDHPLALINDPALLAYDESKLNAHRDMLFDRQVATVRADGDDDSLIDTLQGMRIVVKPDKGAGGRGVEIVERSDVGAVIGRNPDVTLVAQEYARTDSPFPVGIRGLDEDEQVKMDSLSGRQKEIRIFTFRGAEAFETVPVARFMAEGDETSDTWVHIDADSIPEELILSSRTVADRLAAKTIHGEVYAAVDHVWSATEAEPDPRWRVGEFNLWKPAFARKGDPSVARRYDKAVADQLVRLANRNNKGEEQ